jgi:hypothetical protein
MLIREVFKTSFTRKVIESKSSFMIWIPKEDAELLNLEKGSIVRVGVKKLK